jgi:hypothetical protein
MSEYSGRQRLLLDGGPDASFSGEWEDLRFPMTGNGLDTSTGRLYTDYTEGTVNFASNARYPNEPALMNVQLPHGWVQGSNVRPHLHWYQAQNQIPNWIILYRWAPKNVLKLSWAELIYNVGAVFTYPGAGTIHQITKWPEISGAGTTISDMLQIILYRDSANNSGKFAGADPYTVDAETLEFDCHIRMESYGSPEEYTKAL